MVYFFFCNTYMLYCFLEKINLSKKKHDLKEIEKKDLMLANDPKEVIS